MRETKVLLVEVGSEADERVIELLKATNNTAKEVSIDNVKQYVFTMDVYHDIRRYLERTGA